MAGALIGNEVASIEPKRTQTFIVTHDGAGNRLPLMERSFMSFSFGGKHIEDFQLVVTLGDRLSKNLYANFEDVTSQYTTIDGQYYWGTRMNGNNLDFTLSTDYMTQNMLDDFKHWFRPGVERDLILAEHPNRFIRARVAIPPSMNMIPFGENVDYILNGTTYKTKTTIYRGDIQLSFTMCDPYWTGIMNYIPYPGKQIMSEVDEKIAKLLTELVDINTLGNAEIFKMCLEDQLPHDAALWTDDYVNLGIKAAYTDNILLSTTPGYREKEDGEVEFQPNDMSTPNDKVVSQVFPDSSYWAKTGETDTTASLLTYIKVATADISHASAEEDTIEESDAIVGYSLVEENGISINNAKDSYLFYSGTAPSKPEISFKLKMVIDDKYYIINPHNSYSPEDTDKSYIQVGNHFFYFTTPSICTMYNRVLDLLYAFMKTPRTLFELKEEARETIKNKYIRNWLMICVEDMPDNGTVRSYFTQIITKFIQFFELQFGYIYNDEEQLIQQQYYLGDFYFNSKTGEAIGKFLCKINEDEEREEITENVGDMVLSRYIVIDERNYLDDNHLITLENCTKISTNEDIINFKIFYNNMYL